MIDKLEQFESYEISKTPTAPARYWCRLRLGPCSGNSGNQTKDTLEEAYNAAVEHLRAEIENEVRRSQACLDEACCAQRRMPA